MPDQSPPNPGEYPAARPSSGRGPRHPRQEIHLRTLHLRIAVLPAVLMALLGATVVALLRTVPLSALGSQLLGIVAAAVALLALAGAVVGANRATRRVEQRMEELRRVSLRGTDDLHNLVERIQQGHRVTPHPAATKRGAADTPAGTRSEGDTDPFALLEQEIVRAQNAAQTSAVLVSQPHRQPAAAQPPPAMPPAPTPPAPAVPEEPTTPAARAHQRQVEVFVNIARRMQSLVHREISILDDLEARVEDPDLLKGLFAIDLLATQARRQSESLAVLGGATTGRGFRRPVGMYEVLRSAVAEVEAYPRIKVVPPAVGALRGAAVVDVIHLVAELIENAAKFSPAQVMVRCSEVAAGAAIEVEDRGLGMPDDEQRTMNALLADPTAVDIDALLREGRIGLYVVAVLARKHGARVQLQTNIYGGTQAVVVLPKSLISPEQKPQPAVEPAPAAEPGPSAVPPLGPSAVPSTGSAPQRPAQPSSAQPSPAQSSPTQPSPAHPSPAQSSPTQPPSAQSGPLPVPPAPPGGGPPPSPAPPTPAPNGAPAHPPTAPSAAERPGTPAAVPVDNDDRPPLPQRRAQQHMAPQLRVAPDPASDDLGSEHSPGLMAAFRGGLNRAEQEDAKEDAHPLGPDTGTP